jgi:hypothetical protein
VRYAALLMLAAAVGCGSVETKDDARPPAVAADPPPPAVGTAELPDFSDPKPPAPAASKSSKETPSTTREALLHQGER